MNDVLRDRRFAVGLALVAIHRGARHRRAARHHRRPQRPRRHRRHPVPGTARPGPPRQPAPARHRPLRTRRVDPPRLRRPDLAQRRHSLGTALRRGGRRDRRSLRLVARLGRDLLLLGATDFALALPRVVLLLLLAALWQPSAVLVVLLLGATGWMPVARLVHGEVRALAVRPFVEGARSLGAASAARAVAPRPAERADAGDRRRGAGRRQRDPARGRAVVPGTRRSAADAVVGQHDRLGTRHPGQRAVGRRRTGGDAGAGGGGVYAARRCGAGRLEPSDVSRRPSGRRVSATAATQIRRSTSRRISCPPSNRSTRILNAVRTQAVLVPRQDLGCDVGIRAARDEGQLGAAASARGAAPRSRSGGTSPP